MDKRQAEQWFEKAADQGLAIARQNLGLLTQHQSTFTLANHVVEVTARTQILTDKAFDPARYLQMYHTPRLN